MGVGAAQVGDWVAVGTANMHFHRAIAALAGSPRVDEIMSQLLAELRLVFHVMPRIRDFYEPYIKDNERIAKLLEARRSEDAVAVLLDYLDRAERQLLRQFSTHADREPGRPGEQRLGAAEGFVVGRSDRRFSSVRSAVLNPRGPVAGHPGPGIAPCPQWPGSADQHLVVGPGQTDGGEQFVDHHERGAAQAGTVGQG